MSVIARTPAPDGPTPAGATSYQGLIRGEELQLDRGGAGEVVLATYRFTPVSFPG